MSITPSTIKTKISLFLDAEPYAALRNDAAAHRRDVSEHAEHLLLEYLINNRLIDPAAAYRKQVFWYLAECAVYEARQLCRAGKRSRLITLHAIQACTSDPTWAAHYRFYINEDIFKHGVVSKGEINRELGWQIKRAVGGEVEKDSNGKTVNEKVLGEIIQSFTPLRFDGDVISVPEEMTKPVPPPLPKDAFGVTIDPLKPPNPNDRFHAQAGDIQLVTIV